MGRIRNIEKQKEIKINPKYRDIIISLLQNYSIHIDPDHGLGTLIREGKKHNILEYDRSKRELRLVRSLRVKLDRATALILTD